ncbi:schwannomin-interacting protein 1-like isoform X4 [Rhinatrema bivittatum]|uniref:schwannomin-interacting protein 1-like isoform X4 n=1 Tax=Rhinatrema bivittatum TaxID=194408 RepID=UPI0011270C6E|nr:schwannomin-interacting protein 1-like isoform X4 [Rhinatrema bivittatum]
MREEGAEVTFHLASAKLWTLSRDGHLSKAAPRGMEALGLPAMDWGALENHIARMQDRELQQQLQRRQGQLSTGEKAVMAAEWDPAERPRVLSEGTWRRHRNKQEDYILTSRIHSCRSLQLCFMNDSSSDGESDSEERPTSASSQEPTDQFLDYTQDPPLAQSARKPPCPTVAAQESAEPSRTARGEKALRDVKCRLEFADLQRKSLQQLQYLREGIGQDIQRLNVELMHELMQRDELQVERDALLLDLGDWTKVAGSQRMEPERQTEEAFSTSHRESEEDSQNFISSSEEEQRTT